MKKITVIDLKDGNIKIGEDILIHGWVRTRRDSNSGISFLTIYDGSCINTAQIVVYKTILNYRKEILNLTSGCSVKIEGKVSQSFGKNQLYEIIASNVVVIGWVNNPGRYPISAKKHTLEYLRKFAHLRPRTNLIGSITRIRHTITMSIHNFMNKNGFFWIPTPLITVSDTEGSSKMFSVSTLDLGNLPKLQNGKINYKKDFFKKKSFLTVSGQLNGESFACAMSRIYTFGPTFRAEHSNTTKHLAEFWMVEPEMAFSTLEDIIELAESLLKQIFNTILIERIDEINFLNGKIDSKILNRLQSFSQEKFIQIEYGEAIDILRKYRKKFDVPINWGEDLSSEHENFLTEKYFKNLVVIKNYPKSVKAFYMRINDDCKTVASMDILAPRVGEIIGGSQREERLEKLDSRFLELDIDKKNYWWYRDLRKYGTVPHSGFGLGLERLISVITGVRNIRDVTPFPRVQGNAEF